MAVLDNEDFYAYKHALRRDPVAKAEMRAAALSKTQWKAAFQAIEDWFESQRATVKAEIDTAAGVTTSNALAKKLFKAFMQRKIGGE